MSVVKESTIKLKIKKLCTKNSSTIVKLYSKQLTYARVIIMRDKRRKYLIDTEKEYKKKEKWKT